MSGLEKCVWRLRAIWERNQELAAGNGRIRTMAYQYTGCYNCDGHNDDCPIYRTYTNYIDKRVDSEVKE